MLKLFNSSSIIYIDYDASLNIAKQTFLTTSFTDKLNLRFIKAFEYVQRFDFIIRHKSDKLHFVSNALSRFSITDMLITNVFNQNSNDEFDVLFVAFITKMISYFKKRLLHKYILNSNWIKIVKIIDSNEKINISFVKVNDDLIYRQEINNNVNFLILSRMCISAFFVNDILHIIHNESHFEFDRTYEKIICSWYFRDLTDRFRHFLKHCSKCNVNRTKKHKFFDNLQSILFSSIFFHTLKIDFVLTLSKFLSNLWTALFIKFEMILLYSTTYHSQTNETLERTNHIMKIALRHHLTTLKNLKDWFLVLNSMQREFNNTFSSIIKKFSNEICYDFTSCINPNLINVFSNNLSFSLFFRLDAQNNIAFSQTLFKNYYDKRHKNCQLQLNNWVLLKLHKKYNISFIAILNKKLW